MQSQIIAKELHLYKEYESHARYKVIVPKCDAQLDEESLILVYTPLDLTDKTVRRWIVNMQKATAIVYHTEGVPHYDIYLSDAEFSRYLSYFRSANIGAMTRYKVIDV